MGVFSCHMSNYENLIMPILYFHVTKNWYILSRLGNIFLMSFFNCSYIHMEKA